MTSHVAWCYPGVKLYTLLGDHKGGEYFGLGLKIEKLVNVSARSGLMPISNLKMRINVFIHIEVSTHFH